MNQNLPAAIATKRKPLVSKKVLAPALMLGAMAFSMTASAALDATVVADIQAEVLGDVGTAVAAGFAVLAVVLASSIGFSLLGTFIKKGASGG